MWIYSNLMQHLRGQFTASPPRPRIHISSTSRLYCETLVNAIPRSMGVAAETLAGPLYLNYGHCDDGGSAWPLQYIGQCTTLLCTSPQ